MHGGLLVSGGERVEPVYGELELAGGERREGGLHLRPGVLGACRGALRGVSAGHVQRERDVRGMSGVLVGAGRELVGGGLPVRSGVRGGVRGAL